MERRWTRLEQEQGRRRAAAAEAALGGGREFSQPRSTCQKLERYSFDGDSISVYGRTGSPGWVLSSEGQSQSGKLHWHTSSPPQIIDRPRPSRKSHVTCFRVTSSCRPLPCNEASGPHSAPAGSGSGRWAVLFLSEDAACPLADDALGSCIAVLDGRGLASDEPIEPDDDAVNRLASEGRVVVAQAEEVSVKERGKERVLEAASGNRFKLSPQTMMRMMETV